jgi:ATP-binding cassette subfamily B protein
MSAEKAKGSVFEWRLIRRILRYTKPYRGLFALSLFITLTLSLITPSVPYLFQQVLDKPVIAGDIGEVRLYFVVILGILLLQAGLNYSSAYLTGWLGQSVIRDIRVQVFRHITWMRSKFFDTNAVGTLQTRTISDVETLNDVFSEGLVNILGEILQLLAIFTVMLFINWKLTLVVLTTLPIILIATNIFKNKVKASFQEVRKYISRMNAFLQEHITGMLVIQIFNREAIEMKRFRHENTEHRNANLDSVMAYSVFFPVVDLITAFGLALLVWWGTRSILHGEITFGALVAFIMYLQMFFRPIRMLADQFNTLQMGMVSAERIFKLLDQDERIPDQGTLSKMPGLEQGMSIKFDKVTFAYNEPDWVLREVSFEVKPGQKVAIVGATGSGKSTITSLLTRLYEIQEGRIEVNGTDIQQLKLETLRSHIGMVLQDVFLFSGSIYDNITLNNDQISREKAMEAARLVGADEFIQKLPGAYDYNVQERGATLSAGQRQLISFARVLVYNPQLLILDEATANIDTETELVIQEAIGTLMKGRTSIIIAHRLSTIQQADNILVMSKGQIVESGNHQQLLAQNGLYRKLYELQYA